MHLENIFFNSLRSVSTNDNSSKSPEKLSVRKVCDIVFEITEDYNIAAKFQNRRIDGTAFVGLTMTDLTRKMKIDYESASRIYETLEKLKKL